MPNLNFAMFICKRHIFSNFRRNLSIKNSNENNSILHKDVKRTGFNMYAEYTRPQLTFLATPLILHFLDLSYFTNNPSPPPHTHFPPQTHSSPWPISSSLVLSLYTSCTLYSSHALLSNLKEIIDQRNKSEYIYFISKMFHLGAKPSTLTLIFNDIFKFS